MKRPSKQQMWQALGCFLCVVVALRNADGIDGEFGGGWLTGPLLTMAEVGTLLFLLSMVATFVYPRVAAVVALCSSFLCMPLYLFFVEPVLFNRVFGQEHQFKGYYSPGFHWDTSAIAGMITLAVTDYICLRRFTPNRRGKLPEPSV